MKVVERLGTVSQALSDAFRGAGEAPKRRAVLVACEIAVTQSGLQDEAVERALAILRPGESDLAVQLEIEALSDHLDHEYFRLQNEDKPAVSPDALVHFKKARAASAVAFALAPAPEALAEALYEAILAPGDRAGVMDAVATALL
jgi:hypothetical protein